MLADYVRAGANFLDDKMPDWAERITVSDLIMSDCIQCVLGQLFQTYNRGVAECSGYNFYSGNDEEFNAANKWAIAHGFIIDDYEEKSEWRDLWVEQIRQRRTF